MPHQEALRAALLDLERLRTREAAARRESEAMLAALDGMTRAASPAAAMAALLEAMRTSLAAEASAVLRADDEGRLRVVHASDASLVGAAAPAADALAAAPRRFVDLRAARLAFEPADALGRFRSAILAPAPIPGGGRTAVVCLSTERARFTAADLRLLVRMAGLGAQALSAIALGERNALLAAVIDGAAASVSIADARDPDLPLVYVNAAFERLSGYPADEVTGRNCRLLSAEPPDSSERARLRAAVAAREAGEFELLNRRRSGETFLNRLTLFPIRGPDGAPTHLVATQTDVTASRAAERDRDAAERRLKQALACTAQGMLLLDWRGAVVLANPVWRALFPAPEDGWRVGADFVEVWASRLRAEGVARVDARAAARVRRDALFGGGAREETARDGRVLLVEDRATPDGGAISTATDVTSLKTAERLLAERAAAIEAADDGIALCDPQGRFTFMNPRHRAMFGFTREAEAIGLPWSALYDAEERDRILAEAFPTLQRAGSWRGEATGRRRDGAPVDQEMSLTLTPEGGILCVTRDIGERRRSERERARLRDQLQVAQRQEAIGQLAAGLAHDFNNILSAITGSAAMLRDDLGDGHPAQPHVRRIDAAAGAAASMIARLMALGARRSATAPIDLRAPIRDAADLVSAGLPSRMRVTLALPDEPVIAPADPTDVMQVTLNLAINARDALSALGGEIVLSLAPADLAALSEPCAVGALDPARAYFALVVADDGLGMDADEAAQAFKPYFSTKGAAGTGLGLAVVSGIVTAGGGAVRLETALGAGARFTVFWPVDGAAGRASPLPSEGAAAAGRLDGVAALVVDDAPTVLPVLAEALERAGAEVGACGDPHDALEAIVEDPEAWGVLVTDFDMPGMTGADLARAAREAAPDLPIVLCTALPEWRGRRSEGPGLLFDAVVAKPAAPEALVAAARAAMAARRRARPPKG